MRRVGTCPNCSHAIYEQDKTTLKVPKEKLGHIVTKGTIEGYHCRGCDGFVRKDELK